MERPANIEDYEIDCGHELFSCPKPNCTYQGSQITLPMRMGDEHRVRTISHNNINPAWFTMEPFDWFVLVKVDQVGNDVETYPLYLVHHEIHEILGALFFCSYFGGYGNKYYYLKVKHELEYSVPYSMHDALTKDLRRVGEYWNEDFHLLPSKRTNLANNLSFEGYRSL